MKVYTDSALWRIREHITMLDERARTWDFYKEIAKAHRCRLMKGIRLKHKENPKKMAAPLAHTESDSEFIDNWAGWLEKRISFIDNSAGRSNNKAYIKLALRSAIEQAVKEGRFKK